MINSTELLMKGGKLAISRLHLSVNHIPYKSKNKTKTQKIHDTLSSELNNLTSFLRPFREQVLNTCNEISMHLQRKEIRF